MRFFLLVFLFALGLSLAAEACLNLTGQLAGNCVYSSPEFGDLNGTIEFNIQQPTCTEITIDGSKLDIPGEVEETNKDGSTTDYIKLAMSWLDESQETLNFNYIRTISENGKPVDQVDLTGNFKQQGNKIILRQTGIVDEDPVRIYCELYR